MILPTWMKSQIVSVNSNRLRLFDEQETCWHTSPSLQDLQMSMQQQQPRMDHMSHDIASLRGLVEKSRPGTARHHDLEAVEKEVSNLTDRWDKVKSQISDRSVKFWFGFLKKCVTAFPSETGCLIYT